MRRYLAALIIILWSVNLALGFSQGDIEWTAGVSGTLTKGGTLTNGEYMVKAVQFPSPVQGIKDIKGNIIPETEVEPMVFLEVYKSGALIKEIVMNQQSEAYIDPDYEAKISATGFIAKNAKEWIFEYYNPSASILIQLRAKPKLEVTVTADKSTYTSFTDQTITATVTVKNSGEARLKSVDVTLDIGGLNIRRGDASQLHQFYYTMEKGASQSFSITLAVPELADQKTYTLSTNAKGYDAKDLEYKASSSATLTVSPKPVLAKITISKAVRDRIYLQNNASVKITVANGGEYDLKDIHVTDGTNENFELKTNTPLQWNISLLKPGQEWSPEPYIIKPLETNINGFTIPAAVAQFTFNNKPYSISSQTITVVVNGPKLILNKTVNKAAVNISEDVKVTVSLKNVGNIATRVEVNDILPEGTSLVSGSTSLASIFLELNAPQVFNYTIRMNQEGEVKLPAAVANYTGVEYRGTTRSVLSSERPIITVTDPSRIPPTTMGTPAPAGTQTTAQTSNQVTSQATASASTNTPEPTPTLIAPGFEVAFAIIVLMFAAVYRRR